MARGSGIVGGMSWDVVFLGLPAGVGALADLGDQDLVPLATRAEVMAALTRAAPDADWRDPTWGQIEGAGFSIEVSVGDDDPVASVMLHVRGGDGALGVIAAIAEALGRAPVDCSDGTLLDLSSPAAAASLRAWRAYRDRVVEPGP